MAENESNRFRGNMDCRGLWLIIRDDASRNLCVKRVRRKYGQRSTCKMYKMLKFT